MWSILKEYYIKRVIRFFEKNRTAKIVTIVGFFLALALLVTLVYESFYYGFKYISLDVYFGEAVTLYVVELFLLISFLLVFITALSSGIFTLFRRRGNNGDDALLMASPRYGLKLPLALSRITLSSLWPLLVIIIPALFALRQVFGFPPFGFGLGLFGTILLIVFAVLLAVLCLLAVAYAHLRAEMFSLKRIVAMVAVIFALFLVFVWSRFASVDLVSFFQAKLLTLDVAPLLPIFEQFHFFPSHLSALVIYHGSHGDTGAGLLMLGYLGGLVFLALLLCMILQKYYLALWQKSQEGAVVGVGVRSPQNFFLARYIDTAANVTAAITQKEIITFVRNSRGMWWLAFILFMWGIQSASSYLLVRGLGGERVTAPDLGGVVGMLQFGVIVYFVAMLVLRFAFPSFSAERKTAWVIASSPTDLRTVFRAKLVFFIVLFSIFAALFTWVNAMVLGLSLPLGIPMLCSVLLATSLLTTYGLTLGALFPSNETDDPERLSTTLPGLAFIFGALFYGAFAAVLLQKYFVATDLTFFVGFIIVSLVGIFSLVRIAHRALSQQPTASF